MNSILVLAVLSSAVAAQSGYSVPDLLLEATKSGQLRVALPDAPGTTLFAFHANINEAIEDKEAGTIFKETVSKTGSQWVLIFNIKLAVSDIVNYWVFVSNNRLGYKVERSWKVSELRDTFSNVCTIGTTKINGRNVNCVDESIIEENFNGPTIDTSKWIVDHRIPTYTEPNYEFNSYVNEGDTCFFKDGKLFLKPVALKEESQVRGVLNLTDGCTSKEPSQCLYKQVSSFILPPIKSARITSKVSLKYGIVEIRAKLPSGDWIYPIMELESKDKIDGPDSAKIWIAYSRGNTIYRGHGSDDFGSTLLFGGPVVNPCEPDRSKFVSSKRSEKPFSDTFHVFKLEWRPGKMLLYVDSENYGEISTYQDFSNPVTGIGRHWYMTEAPFHTEYVLSLGVAVGGINDFPDGFGSEDDPKPWSNYERNYIRNFFDSRNVWLKTWNGDDTALQIDYVKVIAV